MNKELKKLFKNQLELNKLIVDRNILGEIREGLDKQITELEQQIENHFADGEKKDNK